VSLGALVLAMPAAAADVVRTDLRPGNVVVDGGVSVAVPAPGEFVMATGLHGDGTGEQFGAITAPDGTVRLLSVGYEPGGGSGDGSGVDDPLDGGPLPGVGDPLTAPGACSDTAYNKKKFVFPDGSKKQYKWKTTYNWYFKADSTPSEVTTANARDALKQATTNVTHSNNNCNMADEVGATQNFVADTNRATDINASGDLCQSYNNKDGFSVTSFGDLPSQWLAYTCSWGTKDEGDAYAGANESDMKLNKQNYSWVVNIGSGCTGKWSVEGVATHERGHTFGLAHVSEQDHGNLTMSKSINGTCQNSESTLGRGDVLGLRNIY
jgi:hypothetical protein